jgi:uncharacterized protein
VPEPSVRKPALVQATSAPAIPQLRARRCECGHVFFPPQAYGCERCGRLPGAQAEALLDARGVLTAVAAVRVHTKRPVPYWVGRIALDGGPVIDAVLTDADGLASGRRVVGRLVAVADASGVEALDCLFAPEEQAS